MRANITLSQHDEQSAPKKPRPIRKRRWHPGTSAPGTAFDITLSCPVGKELARDPLMRSSLPLVFRRVPRRYLPDNSLYRQTMRC